MKNLKAILAVTLIVAMVLSLTACGNGPASTSSQPQKSGGEFIKKACLITEQGMGSPFTTLTWKGFEKLKSEGWEVKCIEITDTAEIAEQIRSVVQLGYTSVFTMFDTVSTVALDMADELYELNPATKIFMIDNMTKQETPNCVNLVVDSWEPSFIAGVIAAHTTQKKQIGWICHIEIPVMLRFRDGFKAGVSYVDPTIEVIEAYTGDQNDSVKGQETAKAMIQNNDIDVIYQTANLSGLGVIQSCQEAGIKCIGVDEYQGDIADCVIWSALTDIDTAVYFAATENEKGWKYGNTAIYDIAWGCKVYDQRDYDALSTDMKKVVDDVMKGIKDGTVDVYMGDTEAGTLIR